MPKIQPLAPYMGTSATMVGYYRDKTGIFWSPKRLGNHIPCYVPANLNPCSVPFGTKIAIGYAACSDWWRGSFPPILWYFWTNLIIMIPHLWSELPNLWVVFPALNLWSSNRALENPRFICFFPLKPPIIEDSPASYVWLLEGKHPTIHGPKP